MALLCLIHATCHSFKNRENYPIYSDLPRKAPNKSDGLVLYKIYFKKSIARSIATFNPAGFLPPAVAKNG
jgi:hypothetical protein